MTGGIAALEQVLRSLSLPLPEGPLTDLGSTRRTHVFVLDDLVVKCDAVDRVGSDSMVREGAALELLRTTELPVPRLLHTGELDDGRRWVVLSRLEGTPPADAARPAHELTVGLAGQLGAIVARLHRAVEPPAFGNWARSPRRTVLEEHRQRLQTLDSMAREAWIVPEGELDDLLELLSSTEGPLTDVYRPVLAHRDVQPRNVLVDEAGTVTGLLDFESSAGADPAEDFRVVGLDWESAGFASFAGAYAAAGGPIDHSFADRVAHYVLHWALAVFARLGGIAPDYLAPARTAVERIRAGERPPL